MKFDATYDGPVRGFQLWVNLRARDKMSPPSFQNARADALPIVDLSPGAAVKVLVGDMFDVRSPVDTQGVPCVYLDVMLQPGASCVIPRSSHAADLSSCFVYVYEGRGFFGGTLRSRVRAAVQRADAQQHWCGLQPCRRTDLTLFVITIRQIYVTYACR